MASLAELSLNFKQFVVCGLGPIALPHVTNEALTFSFIVWTQNTSNGYGCMKDFFGGIIDFRIAQDTWLGTQAKRMLLSPVKL